MSEFSDRPFVAGSLVGLRAFGIDALGRLIGPSFPQIFKPGENVAECRKEEYAQRNRPMWYLTSPYSTSAQPLSLPWSSVQVGPSARPTYGKGPCPCGCGIEVEFSDDSTDPHASLAKKAVEPTPPRKPTHTLGGVNCTCGFYAYFDGDNDYKEPTRIAAVIEGYGVCTVGTRGFRASKARLLALVEPKDAVRPMLRDYLHRNYAEVPFFARKRDAVAAFPLTPEPTFTPDDPDFWTRKAVS